MNYSYQDPTPEQVPVGTVINDGNFSQVAPDTPIMVGRALTINDGNFTNVRKDPAWTIKGGNWSQVERCSNLHPRLVNYGLTVCAENCTHATTEELEIDGVVVETIYTYKDSAR